MKRGTLLALIAAGVAGWWLGRQAPEVTRSEAQLHLEPQPREPRAMPGSPVRDSIASARTAVPEEAKEPEPAAGPGLADDAGRTMRQARSAVDQRIRTLRARPSKSA